MKLPAEPAETNERFAAAELPVVRQIGSDAMNTVVESSPEIRCGL